MTANELVSIGAPIFIFVVLAIFMAWRVRVNRREQQRLQVSPQRRCEETGNPLPNDDPATTAGPKSASVLAFESVFVKRPTMLAITAVHNDATMSEVFLQRAFKIDRQHWIEIDTPYPVKRTLDSLMSHVCKLAWVPDSAFERHIYAVSFSPAIERVLKQGRHYRTNAVGADLEFCAIDETGTMLGEAMKMPTHALADRECIQALWDALHPSDGDHVLSPILRNELEALGTCLSNLSEHVSELTVRTWELRLEELVDLSEHCRTSHPDTWESNERMSRIESMSKTMHNEAQRIDAAIVQRTEQVETLEDADEALLHAIAYMYVRDMTVRVLRVCALLRVMSGDKFERELHCANHITTDILEFTNVEPLICAANRIAQKQMTTSERLTRNEVQLQIAGEVSRHAKDLKQIHDDFVMALKTDAKTVQSEIDKCLLMHSHNERFAVRVSDDGKVERLFVLGA